jgi:hypothetical protein
MKKISFIPNMFSDSQLARFTPRVNRAISEIRSRPNRYAPIGLALLAFIVYIAHIHTQGYGGDANLYYEAASASDWFVRPLRFGYVLLLDLSFAALGPAFSNLYVVQGIFSAIAGAISVYLVVIISRSIVFDGQLIWPIIAGAFFAFSGGILITANYGETYMVQIMFILLATSLLLKQRLLMAGFMLGVSIIFTPLSLLLMPISVAGVASTFFAHRLTPKHLGTIVLGAIIAVSIAGISIAIYDVGEFSNWFRDIKISVFNFEGRGPYQRNFVFVQIAWLARGLHMALPLALVGMVVLVTRKKPAGLILVAAAALTLLVNLPVMGRVDDYWRMLMIVNVYGAIFAASGLKFIVERLLSHGRNSAIAASTAVLLYAVISLSDMPQREFAVADEIYSVYESIKNTAQPALVISLWENIDSANRYSREENLNNFPVLVSYPPIQNWVPPENARTTVAEARASEIPIYVIVRNRRYDSPLMRLILGSTETNFDAKYSSILK